MTEATSGSGNPSGCIINGPNFGGQESGSQYLGRKKLPEGADPAKFTGYQDGIGIYAAGLNTGIHSSGINGINGGQFGMGATPMTPEQITAYMNATIGKFWDYMSGKKGEPVAPHGPVANPANAGTPAAGAAAVDPADAALNYFAGLNDADFAARITELQNRRTQRGP